MNVYLGYVEMFDATKETLIIHMLLHVVLFWGTYHFYHFFLHICGFQGPSGSRIYSIFQRGFYGFFFVLKCGSLNLTSLSLLIGNDSCLL